MNDVRTIIERMVWEMRCDDVAMECIKITIRREIEWMYQTNIPFGWICCSTDGQVASLGAYCSYNIDFRRREVALEWASVIRSVASARLIETEWIEFSSDESFSCNDLLEIIDVLPRFYNLRALTLTFCMVNDVILQRLQDVIGSYPVFDLTLYMEESHPYYREVMAMNTDRVKVRCQDEEWD